jgi:hypothetical protein
MIMMYPEWDRLPMGQDYLALAVLDGKAVEGMAEVEPLLDPAGRREPGGFGSDLPVTRSLPRWWETSAPELTRLTPVLSPAAAPVSKA